jgi:hypothetical protein
VRHIAVISFIAILGIRFRNADALSLAATAMIAATGPQFREPKGSCRQHFYAGKMNLILF